MANRRTRKEKEKPHYSFTISYQPEDLGNSREARVKGHFANQGGGESRQKLRGKNAESSAQGVNIEFIKRDIIKSIILVSLILALELVIYLAVQMSVL